VSAVAQRPQVGIDSATQISSGQISVQVDVIVPAGSTANMRFIITKPDGSEIMTGFEPITSGLDQKFKPLFDPIPAGSSVRAEVVANPGGATHSPSVPIS
jgi:hypothetical protein